MRPSKHQRAAHREEVEHVFGQTDEGRQRAERTKKGIDAGDRGVEAHSCYRSILKCVLPEEDGCPAGDLLESALPACAPRGIIYLLHGELGSLSGQNLRQIAVLGGRNCQLTCGENANVETTETGRRDQYRKSNGAKRPESFATCCLMMRQLGGLEEDETLLDDGKPHTTAMASSFATSLQGRMR